jgi:hypothetical protein
MSDEFDELFREKKVIIDKKAMVLVLRDLVVLSKAGGIIPQIKLTKITHPQKIVAVLLAKKVLALKLKQDEWTTPADIQKITGLSAGNINPNLRLLERKKHVIISQNRKYTIPDYFIPRAIEILGDN